MKKVEAFVRHEAFEPIRMELLTLGFPSLSIMEVKGSGRQKGITERYRGAELTNYLRPKVKIECVVASGDVQTVVDTILKHARTGSIGDGKVFVLPVDEAYRIRTGESGEETLQAHPGAATEPRSHRRIVAALQPIVPAPGPSLVERLRAVHLEMVDAVLAGDGLGRVAQLAADAAGATVAIVVPRLGAAAASAGGRATSGRCAATSATRPSSGRPGLLAEVPIASGDEVIGVRAGARRRCRPCSPPRRWSSCISPPSPRSPRSRSRRPRRRWSRTCAARSSRSCGPSPTGSIRARWCAARRGWAATSPAGRSCSAPSSPRTGRATSWPRSPASTRARWPSTWRLPGDAARVYALLPASGADDAPEATLAAARRLAARLQRHGTVGLSSFYADPAELGRAIQEAELVLDVLRRSDVPISEDIGTGTYRLLFRVLASHPEEVRSFYEDTVAPIVAYDDQYATDLVGTLEAYLEHNCNMNATAAAIYAHRHTVAYRLDRVKELAGLDPMQSEDRERLGLGLKAYRIIAPRLPR